MGDRTQPVTQHSLMQEMGLSDQEIARRKEFLEFRDEDAERLRGLHELAGQCADVVITAQAIVLVLDPEGRIVRFNPYLEEMAGYRLEEVQGKDWFTTFVPQRDQSHTRELFWEAVQALQTPSVATAIVSKDGHERQIQWSSKTLQDANGNAIGVLSIGQDITERERAQAWLRSLIDTTQDAVLTIDRQGRVVLFNSAAERIFGYTQAEVQGQKVNVLMPEPYANEHGGYIARYEQTGERRAIGHIRTVAARRKNGEVFPIELSVTEVKADGEVRYGAFIRDISEKVRLQEQLLERERLAAIGTTAAKFAHEVGNPLNGMYMATQLLERHLVRQSNPADERLTTIVRNLTGEIKRLNLLLEEFRSLARRQQLNLRSVPLALVVTDVLNAETPHYTAGGIRVEQVLPPDLPPIAADHEKLKQVLLNLCKNAAEAMPQGGTLTVRARNSGDQVRLEVSDTGVGIPTGVDIFEPFTTTKPQGTGLGLTIVRQIVAAHRGTLTYHSVPGQGTTFTLVLPVSQPEIA